MKGKTRTLISRAQTENGQALVFFVLVLPLVLAILGLVVDGGLMFLTFRRASLSANLAAQAASHAIDPEYFRSYNQVRLDQDRALALARQYAAENAGDETRIWVRSVSVKNRQVQVRAEAVYDTLFLGIAGIKQVPLHVTGTAYPAYGIEREWQ